MLLHVLDKVFNQRRRRRNRVPGDDGDSGEHAAESGGSVAVDDDFPDILVHRLDDEGILLFQRGNGIIEARLSRVEVEVGRFLLGRELLAQGLLDFSHIEREELGKDADINHVLDELAKLRFGTDGGDELVVRHGIKREVGAEFAQIERLVIEDGGAGREGQNVLLSGLRVHSDKEVDFLLAGNEAVPAGANGVPGGETSDVRGKEVLARDWNAHLENGAKKYGIGRLRA